MIIRSLIGPLTAVSLMSLTAPLLAQTAFPAPLPEGVQPAKKDSAFPSVNRVKQDDSVFPPVNGGVIKNDPAFPPVNGGVIKNDPAFPPVNGAPHNASPFPPVNGASLGGPSPFPSNGAPPLAGGSFAPPSGATQAGPPGGGPECMKGFVPLREEAEKRGKAIKAASQRHASAAEACKLIGRFSRAETKMIDYVRSHQKKCGIPQEIADQLNAGHKNTRKMQQQVCNVAEQQRQQQRAPRGPSLSDVLGSPSLPQTPATRHGGGSTFDTLSGNVLTR